MLAGFPKSSRRKGVTGRPDSGRSVNRTSRLFGEGQAGNIALADGIFGESTGVNGAIAGVAEPKPGLQEPLVGFPELSMHIVDMFSAGDKIVTRLVWRRLVPVHMGCRGGRPAGGGCGVCRRYSEDGKVAEISTIQDQFTPLKQIGSFPGGICAA